jgi:hypothetical protein
VASPSKAARGEAPCNAAVTLHSNRGKCAMRPRYCIQIAESRERLYSNRGQSGWDRTRIECSVTAVVLLKRGMRGALGQRACDKTIDNQPPHLSRDIRPPRQLMVSLQKAPPQATFLHSLESPQARLSREGSFLPSTDRRT